LLNNSDKPESRAGNSGSFFIGFEPPYYRFGIDFYCGLVQLESIDLFCGVAFKL
jgi:hypothetical protein